MKLNLKKLMVQESFLRNVKSEALFCFARAEFGRKLQSAGLAFVKWLVWPREVWGDDG